MPLNYQLTRHKQLLLIQEAKSFATDTQQQVSNLINNITSQAKLRKNNLPKGTQQTIKIDNRDGKIDFAKQEDIRSRIVRNSDGAIKPGDIEFTKDLE